MCRFTPYFGALLLAAWAVVSAASGAEPSARVAGPAVPLGETVERLVRQLDAEELGERDAAEKALVALGPGALAALPAELKDLPAEAAERLARVRQQLEKLHVTQSLKPTLITLQGKKMPLEKVLEAFSAQSGNRVVDHRENFGQQADPLTLDVNLSATPFWQALDQVLDLGQLSIYPYGSEGAGVFVVARPKHHSSPKGRVAYAGAFRVEAQRIDASRDLRSGAPGVLRLALALSWEPRLTPIAVVHPLASLKATGDDGEAIAAADSQGQVDVDIQDTSSTIEFELPMQMPPRRITRLASVKGQLQVLLRGPEGEFRFEKLPIDAKGDDEKVQQTRGDATVSISRVRKNLEVWELTMTARFEHPSRALESHRGWILNNKAVLTDRKGKIIEPGGYEMVGQSGNEVGIKYLFELPQGPKGLAFVYTTPVAIIEVPVDYELRDLPLP